MNGAEIFSGRSNAMITLGLPNVNYGIKPWPALGVGDYFGEESVLRFVFFEK